ncbi:BT_3928 family protein [uncultured Duncaniella sp.]|uniref:BT_3928 family protein n=1 Tax=uncultured Duncaniella sp. TaxID=2768039 RepID=UPI002675DCBC|nr:BT_3928 family protein [uncultured Duncaniella sp.]
MQSSQSSNSQEKPRLKERLFSPTGVWALRIIIGAVFILSGFVKGIDPWGSVIKLSEYFTVWGLDIPRTLITCMAFALGAYEFVWGCLLFMGCYRRVSVWALSLMMCVMLPLTLYIAIYSPVDDCGCFGDFLILSNTATFVKNIFISAGLVYLIYYNSRVAGAYIPYIQWIVGGIVTIYILAIELYGYNIQPLIDFRQYAAGVSLMPDDEEEEDGAETIYEFTYEKDGLTKKFTMDALPDSSWTFVSRELISGEEVRTDGFTILEEGEDITADVIDPETEQFLVTIPDIDNVDLSYTYLINELNDFLIQRGGSLVALINSDDEGLERWKDISMASYPIYQADPKMLKELARGNAALVYLDHGVVKWKRTLSSIGYTLVTETHPDKLIATLDPNTGYVLKLVTAPFVIILLIILALDHSGKLLAWHIARRKRLNTAKAEAKNNQPDAR